MIASSFKRFISFLIDFSILAIITSLVSNVVYILIGVPNFTNDYNQAYNNLSISFQNYFSSATDASYNTLLNNLQTFFKYLLVFELVNAGINLVLVPLYLILLPMLWENQTLGRALVGLRVVKNNDLNEKPTLKNLILREMIGSYLLYIIIAGPGIIVSAFFVTLTRRSLADRCSSTKLIDYRLTQFMENNNINPFGPNKDFMNNESKNVDDSNDITSNVDIKDVSHEYNHDNDNKNSYSNNDYNNSTTNNNDDNSNDEDEYTII